MTTTTLTVLFTDLTNYTARVSRSDWAGLHDILREHEHAVHPVVRSFGGRVVKNIGDSFLCLFSSATDALRGALEIHSAMPGERGPELRIAMTTGDVEEIGGDAFGEPVNLAARILSETPSGEIWFGAGTHTCMNEAEVAWEDVGSFAMKGIPGQQPCYRAVPPDRVWLPENVRKAMTERRLVRLTAGDTAPPMPPEPVVLLHGFEAGSEELVATLATLPVLPPGALHLCAYTMATGDRQAWTGEDHELVIGTGDAIDAALERCAADHRASQPRSSNLADTMFVPNAATRDPSTVELALCGLALPAAPFSNVVASYTYDLLADGAWAARGERPLMRVEVRDEGVLLHALRRDIAVGGTPLRSGRSKRPRDGEVIQTPVGELRFQAMAGAYAGLLISQGTGLLVAHDGQTVEIGRSPNPPGLAFPNRPGESNIRWCAGPQAAQARTNGFTLDRVLAGRRQAALAFDAGGATLTPLHESCPTYVLDGGSLQRVRDPVTLHPGDKVVAGTTVVGLRLPRVDEAEGERRKAS